MGPFGPLPPGCAKTAQGSRQSAAAKESRYLMCCFPLLSDRAGLADQTPPAHVSTLDRFESPQFTDPRAGSLVFSKKDDKEHSASISARVKRLLLLVLRGASEKSKLLLSHFTGPNASLVRRPDTARFVLHVGIARSRVGRKIWLAIFD
jgi:hypothetical protein